MPSGKQKKNIVFKIEDDTDRQGVYCTTYQMRNFYQQLRDGYFSSLDIMNYIQHHQIVTMLAKHNHVLDVCCGRGLLLPLLRYHNKEIGSYTGVDIEPKNATFMRKRVTDGKDIDPAEYYPFPVSFVESSAAEMSEKLPASHFDAIVYTASIEHMHRDVGQQSLHECRKVAKEGAVMFLTCPNTPEDQNGYDTQYRAHVYEWKRSELREGAEAASWRVVAEYGLLHDKKTLRGELETVGLGKAFDRICSFVPSEWVIPVFSPLFPASSKEIGMICQAI